jgi:hypothetical protein
MTHPNRQLSRCMSSGAFTFGDCARRMLIIYMRMLLQSSILVRIRCYAIPAALQDCLAMCLSLKPEVKRSFDARAARNLGTVTQSRGVALFAAATETGTRRFTDNDASVVPERESTQGIRPFKRPDSVEQVRQCYCGRVAKGAELYCAALSVLQAEGEAPIASLRRGLCCATVTSLSSCIILLSCGCTRCIARPADVCRTGPRSQLLLKTRPTVSCLHNVARVTC